MPRPKKSESGSDPEIMTPETMTLETMTFEDAFRRLGETAQALEAGGLPLAQATAVYQRGMALVQRCNQLLNETELKITQLRDSYPGSAPGPELPGPGLPGPGLQGPGLQWNEEETDA